MGNLALHRTPTSRESVYLTGSKVISLHTGKEVADADLVGHPKDRHLGWKNEVMQRYIDLCKADGVPTDFET